MPCDESPVKGMNLSKNTIKKIEKSEIGELIETEKGFDIKVSKQLKEGL